MKTGEAENLWRRRREQPVRADILEGIVQKAEIRKQKAAPRHSQQEMNSEDGKTGRRKGTDPHHSPRNPRKKRTHSQSAGRRSAERFLHLSQNPWDWLGHGHYFWEDSYADKRPLPDSGNGRSISPLSPFPPVQSQTHEPTGGNGENGGGMKPLSETLSRPSRASPVPSGFGVRPPLPAPYAYLQHPTETPRKVGGYFGLCSGRDSFHIAPHDE